MDVVIRFNLLKSGAPTVATGAGPAVANLPPLAAAHAETGLLPSGVIHPVLVTDAQGRIVNATDAAAHLLEYDRESLFTLHVADVVGRLDEIVLDLIVTAVPTGRPVVLDVLCYPRNGLPFPAEICVQSMARAPSGEWLIAFLIGSLPARRDSQDVASAVEARIARAERLEMAGTLAGQIAHDFNNLLTPLLAYPDLIRREIQDNPVAGEYLDIMERTTGDMMRLTQQLLSLARRGQVGNDVFSVNDVIEQVVKLMQKTMPAGIAAVLELAPDLLAVKGSKDQVRRVVENLLQNAIDAMGETGRLSVRTENVYLDAPVGQYAGVNIGEYIKIGVTDTGTGIPAEIKDKVFDPFFTTKRASKQRGTGLGLSIVHGIVRDHRGYVDMDTAVGKGSTFHVYLPITRQSVPRAAGDALPHGSEHILVVDDDPLQVQVLSSLLGVLGYKAIGARSGEECVKMIRDEGRRFDLVILDMIMEEGMDGLDTFTAIKAVVPSQRAILISGFSKAARRIVKAQQMGAGTYLRKPLTIERVAAAVREELDRPLGAGGEADAARGKRILIVDDEQMIRKLFGMIILSEFRDAVIDHAANGREAVDAFQEGRHQLIIMDLQMPMLDGREAFSEIVRVCGRKQWTVPPVIFCTGFSPPESLNAIIGDGRTHCLLRKPVKTDMLLDAVRQRLRP
jgi:signal transduction histidine kinase/CheY-like chemotaxis protein